jgi:hypothetical protein
MADAVEDGEELRPVFEETCAEGWPVEETDLCESEPKKRRLKIDTGEVRVAILVLADGTVADACAAAETSGRVGKRRIRTFALPDGCELVAGDRLADAVEDGEELRPVFEEMFATPKMPPAPTSVVACSGAASRDESQRTLSTSVFACSGAASRLAAPED